VRDLSSSMSDLVKLIEQKRGVGAPGRQGLARIDGIVNRFPRLVH